MSSFLTIKDLSFKGKTALVRADLNVPMKDGKVRDDSRLRRFVPTLLALKSAGAKIVVISHFGRPEGKRDEKFSLRPVAAALGTVLGEPVAFAEDCIGEIARAAVAKLGEGDVLVLENTRFYPEEESNDTEFGKKMAELGDYFVNDAFSAAHRAHASTTTLAYLMPCAAGLLMQEELDTLAKVLNHPKKPVAAIIGGSKISSKLDLLRNLIRKVDLLVLGGGMANTFLAAQGCPVGKSLYEPDMLDTARKIRIDAQMCKCALLLPKDVVIAAELREGVETETVSVDDVPENMMIFDIGPQSIEETRARLASCSTILWNGPFGVFETPPFDKGTNAIAQAIAELTSEAEVLSVAGGGDTLAALTHAGATQDISYVSTAGGAFLEWLEGKELPGVVALERNTVQEKD